MNNLTSLFLSQSYQDAYADYNRSLVNEEFPRWDYVVLTASNDLQAEGFLAQIEERRKNAFLPDGTKFLVVPDLGGKRVGSGGATLAVIREIARLENTEDFSGLRILVIHSGGDSKRVPQYSALGKLFSPVPRKLPSGRNSTLFDEFLIATASVPGRVNEGMMLLSGDVLLLFNPLQIDYSGRGAAAITFKEDVETGKNHGVFLCGEDGNVKKCLQKQSVETLRACGAVNEQNAVDIDTGAVIFSREMLADLYSMVRTEEDLLKYVNETVRLSLYGDFLYPLATDSTEELFQKEKPEGAFCQELTEARAKVWELLRPYRMKLLRLAPAKFIHFGTTREIRELMCGGVKAYADLGWTGQVGSSIPANCAGYNSAMSGDSVIGENCYLEVSFVHGGAKIGAGSVLSYVDIDGEEIPENTVLHGLKQKDGCFVARIYGVQDNPKEGKLFGKDLAALLAGVSDAICLWDTPLYPACSTMKEAVSAALALYRAAENDTLSAYFEEYRDHKPVSLMSGFNCADSDAIIAWDKRMQELVQMEMLKKCITEGVPARTAREKVNLSVEDLSKIQREWLEDELERADFSTAMRLHFYTGTALSGAAAEKEVRACFETISNAVLNAAIDSLKYNENARIVCDKHTVKLPLRVNWGGGWSDTPPYCNENGGTVLNAAILLNGEKPVEVTLEKIPELKVIFDSRDMDVHGEFETIEPLQETGNPFDPFALQKAGLLACGVIPKEGGTLSEILKRLGGGFIMRSEVTGVPKGSGLGTSSILSVACVKALFEFLGIDYAEHDLYDHVLAMEQIMSTGGGWQDQVGGVTPGIKYTTSRPGVAQKVSVQHLELTDATKKELNERFALIYTGQRRLARNLLRDVVGRYVGNEPDSLYSLNEIQRMAALMRFELERGNVDEFARLLGHHWELSLMIDEGATNTLINQIFASVDDLIDGKLISGAGGGGFLQVILKKGVTKKQLRDRLKEIFQDSAVDVWDAEIVY